jgi:hypothetical protein
MRHDHAVMAKVIVCECGYLVRGADDEDVVAGAREHLTANHPAVATAASDDDLLAMAQDEPD